MSSNQIPFQPQTNYFSLIPHDLTKYICNLCSKSCIRFMMTNSNIKKLVDPVCYEIFQSERVSNREIKKYLKRQPKIFGIADGAWCRTVFTVKYYGDVIEYYSVPCFSVCDELEGCFLSCDREPGSWQVETGYSIKAIQTNIIDMEDKFDCDNLDVLSLYHIYKKRKSLIQFNPNYVKDMSLNVFQEFISRRLNPNDKINDLYLFANLSIYIWMLNLNIKTTHLINFCILHDQSESSDLSGLVFDSDELKLSDKIRKYNKKIIKRVICHINSL